MLDRRRGRCATWPPSRSARPTARDQQCAAHGGGIFSSSASGRWRSAVTHVGCRPWAVGRPRSCCAGAASCRSPCAGSRRCPRRSAAAARRGRGARSRTPSSSRSRRGCGTSSSTTSLPVSEANSFAMPASRSERSPASFMRAALQRQQARGLDLGRHVGELELDRLVLGDLLAEGLALLRVAQRQLERALGDAHAAGGDVHAADLERVHHLREALVEARPPRRRGCSRTGSW